MTTMLLARILSFALGEGKLNIIDASGQMHRIVGPQKGPEVTMRVHSKWTEWRLILQPRLALGEAYMDGMVTVEDGDIYDLLDLLGRNMTAIDATLAVRWSVALQGMARFFQQYIE